MTEQFRPHPENPKQKAPEAGAGPLGIPPPTPEQSPQGGGSKSPKLDLPRHSEPAKLSKVDAAKTIGVSLGTLYRYINWGRISVEPEGTIDTAEALRFSSARAKQLMQQPTLEERAQRQREAQREYARVNREKILARARQRYHERKEQGLLPLRKKKPKQVFPAPRRPHIE